MKTFLVTISKRVTAQIEVQTSNESVAERRALKMADENAEFFDDYDYLDVIDIEEL